MEDYENIEIFKKEVGIVGEIGYPSMNKKLIEENIEKYNKKHNTSFIVVFKEFTYEDGYKDITEYNIISIKKEKKRVIQLSLKLF